ncbi:hypothetical protein [Amycolatopsis acidicola]|uniref:hypothetical protein n=1 Tax=Amycolatopsis acidicola TaxID=2596893 RepID=UPI001FB80AAE|nr:hypothetical protein [Amycolatopsis acidicola]
MQVDVGVDETGQQHRAGRVDLVRSRGIGAEYVAVDDDRAGFGDALAVEDTDAGQRGSGDHVRQTGTPGRITATRRRGIVGVRG